MPEINESDRERMRATARLVAREAREYEARMREAERDYGVLVDSAGWDTIASEPAPRYIPPVAVYCQDAEVALNPNYNPTRRANNLVREHVLTEADVPFVPANWREYRAIREGIETQIREWRQRYGPRAIRLLVHDPDYRNEPATETLTVNEDGEIVNVELPPIAECGRCGQRKFQTDENYYARSGGGWLPWCRDCTRKYNRDRRRIAEHGRRFGVEIECIVTDGEWGEPMDAEHIAAELREAGINAVYDGYTHEVFEDAWKIVSDSSVPAGWEVVSPPLTWAQRDQVKDVCRVMRNLGAEVDATCGLHVHHEVSDLPLTAFKRLYNLWNEHQPLTDLLTSQGRRNGQWSAHCPQSEIAVINELPNLGSIASAYCDRYRSLNITCYSSYGTVEVRQHQGSLNASKILAWVAYGQAMVEQAANPTRHGPEDSSIDALLDWLPFRRGRDREYLKARARALNPSMTFGDGGQMTLTADQEDDDGYYSEASQREGAGEDYDSEIDW